MSLITQIGGIYFIDKLVSATDNGSRDDYKLKYNKQVNIYNVTYVDMLSVDKIIIYL